MDSSRELVAYPGLEFQNPTNSQDIETSGKTSNGFDGVVFFQQIWTS